MFYGLSAFPLSPMSENGIDEAAFAKLIERLVSARVDSIGALGSTGSYAYLSRQERLRLTQIAVNSAGTIPIIVGVGALRTRDVLLLAEDAQRAGASSVLLAPMSYQKLSSDEVFNLYSAVCDSLSVPLCVYDNPVTTHFTFTDELLGRIASLPNVRSIKIPAVSSNIGIATSRLTELRAIIPSHVSIGVSGDSSAAIGLNAGADVWYSVIAGLFPKTAFSIVKAAQSCESGSENHLSNQLKPLWALFTQYGSIRVIATAAELIGLAPSSCLPLPLKTLPSAAREQLSVFLNEMELD